MKKAGDGANPIWTVATNAFFLFETTPLTLLTMKCSRAAAADGAGDDLSATGNHSIG
jgi:hypothetical protein